MTPFPDCPTPEQAQRAAEFMFKAAWVLMDIANGEDLGDRYIGHIQDALGEIGLEPRPLKTQPPATADALFDAAAYDRSRGM